MGAVGHKFVRLAAAALALAPLAIPVAAVAQGAAATAAAPTLTDYGRLPDFQEMTISDDGKRIAMLVKVDGKPVVLVRENGEFITKLAVGDVKVRDLRWAGNGHLLISTSQTLELYNFNVDQAEFYQTLVLPVNSAGSGEPWTVFSKQRDMLSSTSGIYGARIIGGRPYLFAGGTPLEKERTPAEVVYRFVGGKPALYRIDLTDQSIQRIALAPRNDSYRSWLVDGDGEVGASMDVDRGSGDFIIRGKDGNEITRGETENGYVALTAFGQSSDTVIYRKLDDEDDYRRYFEVPLGGGTAKESFADIQFDGLYIDGATNRLKGYYREDVTAGNGGNAGESISVERVFFDQALNRKVALIGKAFPGYNTSIRSASDDYSRAVVRIDGNRDSGSWFDVNLEQLSADALGYERPKITPVHVGPVRAISYSAADGLEIDALLTLPPGKEPTMLPVVILPHGGPTSEDRPGFDWWAQAVASRGYAVLQPNFRGSTNRDRTFIRAGHGEWGRKMQTDLSDGLAHLVEQGIADPKRACIMGASYGGYAALAGVTLQNGIYRCAISVAGVSDLTRMVSTDIEESGNDKMIKRNLELQVGKGRDLKDVSPRRFAQQADAPVLLIHGKDDVVVPYSHSYAMADALKDARKPYELVTLDGEDHWLSREDTRLKMLTSAVAFLEKHNPPE